MNRAVLQITKLTSIFCLLLTLMTVVAPANHTTASANLTATPNNGPAPLAVTFNLLLSPSSSLSCLPDSYTLEFGDGSFPATGGSGGTLTLSHTYSTPGTYIALLQYSMEADHGDSRRPDCQLGSAVSQVVITVLKAENPSENVIQQQAVALYSILQAILQKLMAAQAFAHAKLDEPADALDPIADTLSALLMKIISEIDQALPLLHQLMNLPELEGTALQQNVLGVIQLLEGLPDGSQPGTRERAQQIIEALDGRVFDGFLAKLDIIAHELVDRARGWVDWLDIESVVEAYYCSFGPFSTLATIIGTTGPDTLNGTDGPDIINGRSGDDIINGLGGDDVICGRNGIDDIHGGAGSDLIFGDDGSDILYGDENNDRLFGDTGLDTLYGGSGDDELFGGVVEDKLFGEAGNDVLWGESGFDELHGGPNDDELHGGEHDDLLYGEDGNDKLFGEDGKDLLDGGFGLDELNGGDDDDTLFGGENDDFLDGRSGNDLLDGGGGNDVLHGDSGDDILFGGTGNDELRGGADPDRLFGEDGNDKLYGDDFSSSFGDICDGGAGAADLADSLSCETIINVP